MTSIYEPTDFQEKQFAAAEVEEDRAARAADTIWKLYELQAARVMQAQHQVAVRDARLLWDEENKDLLAGAAASSDLVKELEDAVRADALAAYQATGKRKPFPGVEVKLYGKVEYAADLALAWAIEHKIALALDKKPFERIVKDMPVKPPGVTVTEEPRATIATALAKALGRV